MDWIVNIINWIVNLLDWIVNILDWITKILDKILFTIKVAGTIGKPKEGKVVKPDGL